VISTPKKPGTTWMGGIVDSLLRAGEDDLSGVFRREAWPDLRADPVEDMIAQVEGMDYRRSMKTQSPAECCRWQLRTCPIFWCIATARTRSPHGSIIGPGCDRTPWPG
jgi:hypothetical protein